MTSKTTIGLVAVGLALTAMAPTASAAFDDDTISRMFPYLSVYRAEVDPQGIGWYDAANPPNVCIITLLGVQITAGSDLTYYDQLRIFPNFPGWTNPVTVGVSQTIPAPCPPVLNPLCTLGTACGIQLRPVTVGPAVRTIAPQSGIVCDQASGFIECIITEVYWAISWCDWDLVEFLLELLLKGLLAGTGLEEFLLSNDVECNGAGYRVTDPATQALTAGYYDVTYLLGNPDLISSGFDGVTASLMVPYAKLGDNTGYVVSCLETEVTEIDTSTPIPTITTDIVEDGEDWFLGLDLDAVSLGTVQTNWVGAISAHLGAGSNGQLLAGLYNLGGDNEAAGSDGNTAVGPGDGVLCDFAPPGAVTLPACHDGLDNDNDGRIDEGDPSCYEPDPNLGGVVTFYDATDNTE